MTSYHPESTRGEAARIELIYFDAGGGHRASATALMAAAVNSVVRGASIRSTCATCWSRLT